MKHKKIIIFFILIILVIIGIIFFINTSKASENEDAENMNFEKSSEGFERRGKKSISITSTSEVTSALVEDVELHATYNLSKVYVEENDFVKKGDKILKYTNGKYLKAPYDCYIVELNVPEIDGKCLNSNFVKIESKNMLKVSLTVDETEVSRLNLGDEASIEISATSKSYKGYITHIGSIASNGKFDVTVEFENDGDVKLGMTSNVKIENNF